MKIYWCETVPPNVGDALNVWLWPRLIPELESMEKNGTLVGIGSVLDRRLNSPGPKYILGSGVRAKSHGILNTADLTIYSVRGPLSADALGIPTQFGIIDPAAMVARLYRSQEIGSDIGIVPYFTASSALWASIGDNLGYRVISPHLSPDAFLSELSQCRFVITEAMHGAILADSLRIPWHPIRGNSLALEGKTNEFKWIDWTRSLSIPFSPLDIPPLWDEGVGFAGRFRSKVKLFWIERKLKRIVESRKRYLSEEVVLNDKLDRFEETVARFRAGSPPSVKRF